MSKIITLTLFLYLSMICIGKDKFVRPAVFSLGGHENMRMVMLNSLKEINDFCITNPKISIKDIQVEEHFLVIYIVPNRHYREEFNEY